MTSPRHGLKFTADGVVKNVTDVGITVDLGAELFNRWVAGGGAPA